MALARPPLDPKQLTWFSATITPAERVKAWEALSVRTRQLLQRVGYEPGTVPSDQQLDALFREQEKVALKSVVRACGNALATRQGGGAGTRDDLVPRYLGLVNEILNALKGAELLLEDEQPVIALAQRVVSFLMEELERRAAEEFRAFPSSDRYGRCLKVRLALEALGLPQSPEYPVSPWPRCHAMRTGVYVVQRGDTLSKIAKAHYGQENLWDAIYEQSGYRGHPDFIEPGERLTISNG